MSLINTEVKPFKATAYLNGEFIDVTEADLKVSGPFSSSTRPTSPSFARLSWATWLTTTKPSRSWALKFTAYLPTPTLLTKHGTTALKPSASCSTR